MKPSSLGIVFLTPLLFSASSDAAPKWQTTERVPLGTTVVRVLPGTIRPEIYAVDRANSQVLVIRLADRSIQKIYVGKDPTDLDLDVSGKVLYVANKGPGTGAPGSDRISVINLEGQTPVQTASWIVPVTAQFVTAGRPGRIYFNAGIDNWNFGDAHAVDSQSGSDLGTFALIKTRMVITSDKTRLYGQYVYEGNLGEMGVFDVSGDTITLIDRLRYPPYAQNYGWGVDNYCISANDRVLGYGPVLFNATNLVDQIGILPEQVGALNWDGTVAFGQSRIWDTTTFSIRGDATEIGRFPFMTSVMAYDRVADRLYAFNSADRTVYVVEKSTTRGIPLSWLATYSLPTDDATENADPDGDGYTNLQEWTLDSNPKQPTPPLRIELTASSRVRVSAPVPTRQYTLEVSDSSFRNWSALSSAFSDGQALEFAVDRPITGSGQAFFRIHVSP